MNLYRTLSAFAVFLVFSATLCWAQEITGTISGLVKDEGGGVLPGVSVIARNTETGATRTVVTDDVGRYRIPQLAPGSYELRAELPGFQTAVLQNIGLSLGQEAVVNVTLRVGEITEQVVVSAEVPLIDTRSATVASLVDTQQVRDLPLNGRDFLQLAALQEGVLAPASARRTVNGDMGVKISIGGARPYDNAILLDGTDIKNQYGTTPGSVSGSLLGVDTVREFRVITNVYSAEYGRLTGGVVSAITRSGTNELHGSLFEFHRNSALDARNFFDRDFANPTVRSSPPPFKRNQFGFTLGGPIQQDRTFYFGSYEGLRERLTTTEISNFPNADARVGLIPNQRVRGRFICGNPNVQTLTQCNVGVNPRVKPYLDLYPLPNGPDNGDGSGQFFFANPEPTDEDYFVVKVDHKLTQNDDFYVRYTFDQGDFSFLNEGFIYGIEEASRNQYVTIEEKHLFSPSLLNEFRFALNRSHSSTDEFEHIPVSESLWFVSPERQRGAGFNGGMGLLFCQGCGLNQFGTTTRTPQIQTLNTFQYIDNLVWTRSRHSLKMGVSWSRFQFNAANFARLQGTYRFSDLRSFLQAQFTESTVYFGDLQGNTMPLGLRQNLIGLYLQDDFQARPNLTFNLGVRYELITSPTEVAGRVGNFPNAPFQNEPNIGNPYFDNPSLKNFSPRIGFAWDPTNSGKFSLRGGFGLFHQQILQWCCTSSLFRNTPFAIRAVLLEGRDNDLLAQFPTALRSLGGGFRGALGPGMQVVGDPNQPYMMQWSLTLQRELFNDIALTVGYSGSRGVKLPRVGDVNRPPAETLPGGGWFYPNPTAGRINATFADITTYAWDANSFYHSLKMGLRKRFAAGHMYQLSYQWQKSIDDGSGIAGSPRETFNDAFLSANMLDHTQTRGLSSFSVPHTFSGNWGIELPFGQGRRWGANATGVGGKLIEGWQINGIVQMAAGAPQNIEGNARATCTFCSNIQGNIRPGAKIPKSEDPTGWFIPGETMRTISDDDFIFTQPVPGHFGNLARNAGEGPGLATLDVSILKNFFVSETARVEFRAEFFNVLNRTNFQGPARSRFTHTAGGTINRTFGLLTETATTSRQIQFGLKIIF
ncbi:MAG: TonB-dependent receptor [Acidobacteria bacterium]|nr:TonB-dependent receptor [Acidobacteriota bacterium]